MIGLWALVGAAWASGVLYRGTDYAELATLDVDVEVAGRVAGATTRWSWPDVPSGRWTFATVVPEGASVSGLRYRQADGDWISAGATHIDDVVVEDGPDGDLRELLPGEVFSTPLPSFSESGELALELSWQQVLRADEGALSLVVPLDDAGLNPVVPQVSVAFDVVGLEPVIEATLSDGEVTVAGTAAAASWSGELDEVSELALTWTEEPGEFGVALLAYRPEQDPFTGETGGPGYGLLVLVPGVVDESVRVDQLFTFVVDTSDSMGGAPLETAVAAGGTWLEALEERDRFNVIPYASQSWAFRATAPTATEGAVERAVAFLERQAASGLSDPAEALTSALDLADDTLQQRHFLGCGGTARGPEGDAPPLADNTIEAADGGLAAAAYVVWLTDGGATVGETDPDAIAWALSDANTLNASLYALGIGAAADTELLGRLARENRGEAGFVADSAGVAEAVGALQARLADPLLVQPEVWVDGGWDQAPAALEDLSGGHELLLAFRFEAVGEAEVRLGGLRGPEDIDQAWTVVLPAVEESHSVIARAWAQLRVRDLDIAWLAGDTSVYSELLDLVETYGVASDVVTVAFDTSAPESAEGDAATAMVDSAGYGCSSAPPALGWPLWAGLLAACLRRRAPR